MLQHDSNDSCWTVPHLQQTSTTGWCTVLNGLQTVLGETGGISSGQTAFNLHDLQLITSPFMNLTLWKWGPTASITVPVITVADWRFEVGVAKAFGPNLPLTTVPGIRLIIE